jgi:hypothetical protein
LLAVASLSGDCGERAESDIKHPKFNTVFENEDDQFRTGVYGSTVGAPNV